MKDSQNEFMQHELRLPELTVRGMLLGAILTIIFTASNVYLGLKVGLTFSSAIPAAVISMAVLKMAKDVWIFLMRASPKPASIRRITPGIATCAAMEQYRTLALASALNGQFPISRGSPMSAM